MVPRPGAHTDAHTHAPALNPLRLLTMAHATDLTPPLLWLPWGLTLACLVCVAGLLWADHHERPLGRVLGKLGASSCFVALALVLGAPASRYGQWLLLALVLGWLGDALLLARHAQAFLAGLGAFLLSHLAFAAAFALTGPVSSAAMAGAAVLAAGVGWGVLRWLLPHVTPDFKAPVLAYVAVILAMCITAAGHAAATGRWPVLAGAVLFAASDLSVARDRFVRLAYVNRLWGWPTYFVAQLVLAWSVWGVG